MLDVGATIGDYRLDRRIGRGGMGVVFRATQLSLGRPVALKLILPGLAEDPTFRERFKREARLAAQIDHPNVVPVYQADEHEGHLYIAMRYVPGTDLRDYSILHGQLDPPDAVRIVEQVAAALDAAHEQGLVHRDVKPGNILLSGGKEGAQHVYLTDFGLTKRVSGGSLTHSGSIVGTLDYIAPEQLRGAPVDGRADVYALGCVLYELLTARVPFERDSDAAKLYAHTSEPPPRPSEVVPALPGAFDAVVRRAMAKDVDARYESAGELAAAARGALTGDSIDEAPTLIAGATPPPKPARWRSSRRVGAIVAVCGAGAIAAIIGFASGGPKGADAAVVHERAINAVCQQSNRVQQQRLERIVPFEVRLKRLRALASTRDHILTEIELRLSASTDLRARLDSTPPPPAAKAAVQRNTLLVWERNLRRLRTHRDALSNVRTFAGLLRILERQPRAAIERDSTTVTTGLRRLGGPSCRLDQFVPDPVIRVRGRRPLPTSRAPRVLPPPSPRAVPRPAPQVLPPPVAQPPAPPRALPPSAAFEE